MAQCEYNVPLKISSVRQINMLLFKEFILCVCMRVRTCACEHMCRYPNRPEEGLGSLGTLVMNHQMWVLGIKPKSCRNSQCC